MTRADRFQTLVLIAGLLTWRLAAAAGPAAGPSWEVHYQVTYADGTVRDVNEVPRARKHIRRVVRICRREDRQIGYEMLSTGPHPLKTYDSGRTVKRELAWNGRAWVAPQAPLNGGKPPRPAQGQDVLSSERRRAQAILRYLRGRLAESDHAVAEAQRELDKAKGKDQAAAATKELDKAREQRQVILKSIELHELQMKALSHLPPVPTGELQAADSPLAAEGSLGLREEVRQVRTLPYRVQTWRLPPGEGRRSYTVSMAHPEAGALGAFHYVAYADTDNDGRPDRLIARSPLAQADTPGAWTRWQFTTDEPIVFVGNAWTDPNTAVYAAYPTEDFVRRYWRGLSNDVHVSGFFGGLPSSEYPYAPYLTNIRVHVANPFGPTESPPSEVIIR